MASDRFLPWYVARGDGCSNAIQAHLITLLFGAAYFLQVGSALSVRERGREGGGVAVLRRREGFVEQTRARDPYETRSRRRRRYRQRETD
eukprot:6196262-Pleurochrysis_carterae.AAC.2